MTPAMQRCRQTLGANLALNQADAQAREPAGTKLGSSRDQVTPEVKGFSRANLMYVGAFAEAWPDAEIVQQPVGQFPWGQNLPSIEQIEREVGGQ